MSALGGKGGGFWNFGLALLLCFCALVWAWAWLCYYCVGIAREGNYKNYNMSFGRSICVRPLLAQQ